MAQQFDHSLLVEQEQSQRATVFRVYNYYRIGLAFLFLYLFLNPNLKESVGESAGGKELFARPIQETGPECQRDFCAREFRRYS